MLKQQEYDKTIKTIDSCRNIDHLMTVINWKRNLLPRLSELQVFMISEQIDRRQNIIAGLAVGAVK